MHDDLRTTLAERAADLSVPDDLLARVEAGAHRVRRRRALATGSAVVLVTAVAALVAPLAGRDSAVRITTGVAPSTAPLTETCVPGAGVASPNPGYASAATTPANDLDWPCRGSGLTLLPPTIDGAPAGDQSVQALWEGHTSDGRQVGVFQVWGPGSVLVRTATVVERGRTSVVTLPGDTAAIVTDLPVEQAADSEGLLVVAAPDVTSAVYDDGHGHSRPLPLVNGVYSGLRDADRATGGIDTDGVTLTRPSGPVRIGVDDQQHPATTVPNAMDLTPTGH